jgi:hypothetical protein
VLVNGAHLELLEVTTIWMGAGGLTGSLICFKGMVSHEFLG